MGDGGSATIEHMNSGTESARDLMQRLGQNARQAATAMARADSSVKNNALKALAKLLRDNIAALQIDNAKDLERAMANNLSATGSAFAELLAATSTMQTDFFTFHFTRIAGHKTSC